MYILKQNGFLPQIRFICRRNITKHRYNALKMGKKIVKFPPLFTMIFACLTCFCSAVHTNVRRYVCVRIMFTDSVVLLLESE